MTFVPPPNGQRPDSPAALLEALRRQAEARACAPQDLLVHRLAAMHTGLVTALGEVAFEQFYNPGPDGYVIMHLAGSGFSPVVQFQVRRLPEAVYEERLLTPGALQQCRAQWLARIRDNAILQGGALAAELAENQLIHQLRNGEQHWDGRPKAEIAVEILNRNKLAKRALSLTELDPVGPLPSSAPSASWMVPLAQQVLAG